MLCHPRNPIGGAAKHPYWATSPPGTSTQAATGPRTRPSTSRKPAQQSFARNNAACVSPPGTRPQRPRPNAPHFPGLRAAFTAMFLQKVAEQPSQKAVQLVSDINKKKLTSPWSISVSLQSNGKSGKQSPSHSRTCKRKCKGTSVATLSYSPSPLEKSLDGVQSTQNKPRRLAKTHAPAQPPLIRTIGTLWPTCPWPLA